MEKDKGTQKKSQLKTLIQYLAMAGGREKV